MKMHDIIALFLIATGVLMILSSCTTRHYPKPTVYDVMVVIEGTSK